VISVHPRTRYAAVILLVALIASLAVAAFRLRTESQAKRVELTMDYSDFAQFARSYDYDPEAFLVQLRRAGLTSLALTEQLGGSVGTTGDAFAATGASLLNQARLSPLADPLLESLARANRLSPDAIYIVVFNPETYRRFRAQLPLHFEKNSIRVLRATRPWIIELHTQLDYFDSTGLGIPNEQIALAKRLDLLVDPRFQNDERFTRTQMEAELAGVLKEDRRISTVIFFGLRNQVFGYPDHLPDAAALFTEHGPKSNSPLNFGTIETYDQSQVQKGNDTLGRMIPNQIVRVQSIAKTELDKLQLEQIVGRYVLGVRERNVRVVYLRPWPHQDRNLSIEATNVEMVKQIADELKAHGFTLGRASPIPRYHGDNRLLVGVAALAVPSIFVLLLGVFGWYRKNLAIAAYALTLLLYAAGAALHHDMLARSVIALGGALLFATAAFFAIGGAFVEPPAPKLGGQLVRSIGWTLLATAVALLGALVVVGLMSSPLAMQEIERFRGVKLVLAFPPLAALCLYVFDRRYGSGVERPNDVFLAPIRVYQLLAGIAIVGAAALLLTRSGNESDIAPTHFELMLRSGLTDALSVRPRFKEFLVGYPCLMLIPALLGAHRRVVGWLLAIGAGVGIGDVVDTFSHLHTPLEISLLRIFNGLVIGIIIGAVIVWLYRRATLALGLLRVR
jgi:hypothetical protein